MIPFKLYDYRDEFLGILYVPEKTANHLLLSHDPFYLSLANTPPIILDWTRDEISTMAGSYTHGAIHKHVWQDGIVLVGFSPKDVHKIAGYAFVPSVEYIEQRKGAG